MRTKFIGLALAAIAASPAAAVQPVTITSTGIYNPGHLDATTNGVTKDEFSVPLVFTATSVRPLGTDGKPATFDALGFCVDLAHNIYVGVGSQLAQTLSYHVAPLTTDGAGNALTHAQIGQIGGLAHYGFAIAKGNASDKAAQLAGIQQAIWTIEYPKSGFVATGGFAAAQSAYAAQFVALAPTLHGFARTIVADNGNTQAQITNIGGVPEPTVWVEMLAGFGVVGALSRRRAARMTSVAA